MIEAKDLRIGNLITDGTHQILRVNTVYQKYVTVDGRVSCHYSDLIRGIELTPKILVAAGFKGLPHFTVQNSIQLSVGRRRFISIGDVGTPNEMVFLTEEEPPKVNSVIILRNFDYDGKTYFHHIQNLYHSLTGEELKIELPTTGKE